jgi:hypothetical protein
MGATYVIVCNDAVTEEGRVILDTDRAGLVAHIQLLAEPFRGYANTKFRRTHV